MPEDCSEKLYSHINRKIRRLIKGYDIIDRYSDGCDEYGYKYCVECKNSWSGNDWELREQIFYSVRKYLESIVLNGIKFGGNLYYIHPDIVFGGYYKFNTITLEEHTQFNDKLALTVIRNKIHTGYNNYMKDKGYWSYVGPRYYGINHKLLISTVENFKLSLIVLVKSNFKEMPNIEDYNCHKIKNLLKLASLTQEEWKLLDTVK